MATAIESPVTATTRALVGGSGKEEAKFRVNVILRRGLAGVNVADIAMPTRFFKRVEAGSLQVAKVGWRLSYIVVIFYSWYLIRFTSLVTFRH